MRKLLHRGHCTQKYFCREMLSQDGFTHAHTDTLFLSHTHTHTHTHGHTFTQRWFCTKQLYTQRMVLLQKNGFTRGASIYNGYLFTQAYSCMISDGGRVFRATSVQQADVKPQFHHSFWQWRRISCETGWSSASPRCNFIVILGDRHFVRGGCVSWTSIHAALPPKDEIQKNF